MAANDVPITRHENTTLTTAEIQSLADRLLSRGLSALSASTPEQASDLRLASAALRALVAHWATSDVVHLTVLHPRARTTQ